MKNTITTLLLLLSVICFAQNNKEKPAGIIALDEVVVLGKQETYDIVRRAINNLKNNYPDKLVSSSHVTNVTMSIDSVKCLDFDFTANQCDKGYMNRFRSAKQLQQIRYNLINGYNPKELRNFYPLRYNNPIKYGCFLKKTKYKKFRFELDEIKMYNGKEVFVISYSTSTDSFQHTGRILLSDYSGTLYINKDDYAIVKIIQEWKFKGNQIIPHPLPFVTGDLNLYNKQHEFIHEKIVTDYEQIDGVYYKTHSNIYKNGSIKDPTNNKSKPFIRTIKSFWSDFKIDKNEKIKYKNEKNLFEKVKYNKSFWDNYQLPI